MNSDLVNRNESGFKYSVGTPPQMRRLPRLGQMAFEQAQEERHNAYVHDSNEVPARRQSLNQESQLEMAMECVEAAPVDMCNWS
eukprot:CFRG3341T1